MDLSNKAKRDVIERMLTQADHERFQAVTAAQVWHDIGNTQNEDNFGKIATNLAQFMMGLQKKLDSIPPE